MIRGLVFEGVKQERERSEGIAKQSHRIAQVPEEVEGEEMVDANKGGGAEKGEINTASASGAISPDLEQPDHPVLHEIH